MKAELVENTKGERRILLTSESADERALIQQIGNAYFCEIDDDFGAYGEDGEDDDDEHDDDRFEGAIR